MSDELFRLTAVDAVHALMRGNVSPLDMIDAAAQRIEIVEPLIHALPTLCLDRARDYARRLTSRTPGESSAWLAGLPLAVKDNTDVANVRTTNGSPIYRERIAGRSHPVVERIEERGGIVIAKSNLPEFAFGGSSYNTLFPSTRNPWNIALTAGGSSGGSAAALAAGEIWLAHGTDHGGSLRQPASYCGVVGFRPSAGLVSRGSAGSLWSPLSQHGPMARTVRDLALFLDVMAGHCRWDPMTFDVPHGEFSDAVASAQPPKKRVAFTADFAGKALVDGETRDICARAARRFEDLGCVVVEACPDPGAAADAFAVLRAQHILVERQSEFAQHRDLINPDILRTIEQGLAQDAARIAWAELERARFFQRTATFFEDYDLLISPCVATPAFDVSLKNPPAIGGKALESYMAIGLAHTGAITLAGLPAISVPCGFDSSGRPIGLQIAAAPRDDARVLQAAALFEEMANLSHLLPIDPRPGVVPNASAGPEPFAPVAHCDEASD